MKGTYPAGGKKKGTLASAIIAMAFLSSLFVSSTFGTDPVKGIPVSGTLTEVGTGTPIRGEIVFMMSDGTAYNTSTGEKGGFELYLPGGEYYYTAYAEGYQKTSGAVKVSGERVKLLIEMEPVQTVEKGFVRGVVINHDEKGIPGAIVTITHYRMEANVPAEIVVQAKTNDNGVFEVELPFGYYGVSVEARGYNPGDAQFQITAEQPRVDLTIMLGPASNNTEMGGVHGIVTTKDGKGISGAIVVITEMSELDSRPPSTYKLLTGEEGKFESRLPFAFYWLKVEARGFQAGEAEFRITSDQPRAEVKIVLLPLDDQPEVGIVHGFVFTGKERGIPYAMVYIVPMTPPPIMGMPQKPVPQDANDGMDPSTGMPGDRPDRIGEKITVKTDENGKFTVRVPYGAYYAVAEAQGFDPGKAEFKVNAENPEVRVIIALERFQGGERKQGRTVSFEMVDRNSDGNPERVYLMIELNGERPPELLLEMIDRDSDGNPESTVFELNAEPRLMKTVLALLRMYMGNTAWGGVMADGQFDPSTGTCNDGCSDANAPGIRQKIKDLIDGYMGSEEGPDETAEQNGDPGTPDGSDGTPEGDPSGSDNTITPKGSSGGSSTKDLLTGIGIITILLGVLGIVAFMSLKKKN